MAKTYIAHGQVGTAREIFDRHMKGKNMTLGGFRSRLQRLAVPEGADITHLIKVKQKINPPANHLWRRSSRKAT